MFEFHLGKPAFLWSDVVGANRLAASPDLKNRPIKRSTFSKQLETMISHINNVALPGSTLTLRMLRPITLLYPHFTDCWRCWWHYPHFMGCPDWVLAAPLEPIGCSLRSLLIWIRILIMRSCGAEPLRSCGVEFMQSCGVELMRGSGAEPAEPLRSCGVEFMQSCGVELMRISGTEPDKSIFMIIPLFESHFINAR
jgi:hypothetical protein